MHEGFGYFWTLIDELEAVTKGRSGEAALRRDRLLLERERQAFEQEKRLERAMRAVRDHTFG